MSRSILILFLLFICSCTKEQKIYNQTELNHFVDSSLKAKMPILNQQAEEDFINRLPIELKYKVDSILNVSYDIPVAPELGDQTTNSIIDTTNFSARTGENTSIPSKEKPISEIKK